MSLARYTAAAAAFEQATRLLPFAARVYRALGASYDRCGDSVSDKESAALEFAPRLDVSSYCCMCRTAVYLILLCTLDSVSDKESAALKFAPRLHPNYYICVLVLLYVPYTAVYHILLYALAMRATLLSLTHTAACARHARYSSLSTSYCCMRWPCALLSSLYLILLYALAMRATLPAVYFILLYIFKKKSCCILSPFATPTVVSLH